MAAPTTGDVAAWLGETVDDDFTTQATAHLNAATMMVKAYVRGNGFDDLGAPEDDLAAVIVSCCARIMGNPQASAQMAAGPFSITPGTFSGWTLPELAVLHRYRRRAM